MTIRYTSSFDQTIAFSDTCAQFQLQMNIVQTYTVPGTSADKYSCLFELPSTANLLVGYNVTAAIPALNTNNTTSQLEVIGQHQKRYLRGGDVLSLLTPDTNLYLGLSLRSIPS